MNVFSNAKRKHLFYVMYLKANSWRLLATKLVANRPKEAIPLVNSMWIFLPGLRVVDCIKLSAWESVGLVWVIGWAGDNGPCLGRDDVDDWVERAVLGERWGGGGGTDLNNECALGLVGPEESCIEDDDVLLLGVGLWILNLISSVCKASLNTSCALCTKMGMSHSTKKNLESNQN